MVAVSSFAHARGRLDALSFVETAANTVRPVRAFCDARAFVQVRVVPAKVARAPIVVALVAVLFLGSA